MKIGIMSDSHDNISNIKKAVNVFKEEEIKVILHAGDLISPFCLNLFEDFKGSFHLCNGNNLGDTKLIKGKIKGLGHFYEEIGEIEIADFKFALYHGTDETTTKSLLDSQKYDYLITGHTHHKELKTVGKTILINPGETFGDLYGEASIAILDIRTRNVIFHDLK